MREVNFLDDLTWESKSYEDGEKREFCNVYGLTRNREIKLTGTGEFKGNVLELNFNSILIPNFGKKTISITHKMLKVPKEIGVVIKTDGETMYFKEKNAEVISQIIGCRDIDAFFFNLEYMDLFFPDIYLKSSDGKFFANCKSNKLQEISIADEFYLTVDNIITQSRENDQKTYGVKKQYKIKVSNFLTACQVYGHLRNFQIFEKIDSEGLNILGKMLKDEIEERLPELILDGEKFKGFANSEDRTPENLFAVQKLYDYIPKLDFAETVNTFEKLDDATFEFWLCGLENEMKVQYSKGAIEFHVKNKINFEKMFELFQKLKTLRKYGRIFIFTEEKELCLKEMSEKIVFHKGKMIIKDLKLLGKHSVNDKKVEMLINDRDRFVIDGNGKIGISKNCFEKYNLKNFETYIL